MFPRLSKFKLNGWAVIAIAVFTVIVVNVGVRNSKQARQEAATLVTSLPVKESGKIDGTNLFPAKADAVEVDPKTGTQRYGRTTFTTDSDEITGDKTMRLVLLDKNDSGAGVGLTIKPNRTSVTFIFSKTLERSDDQRATVQARFTLRDGTAVVREYIAFNPSGSSAATMLAKESVDDFLRLISLSAYVAFRAYAYDGDPTLIRTDVEPVDWIASESIRRIITLDEAQRIYQPKG